MHTVDIPVRLLNTMDPEAPGTLISNDTEKGKIKAVAAKENITAIKIKSSRMLLAHGFLRKVFEIFESYQTSIDMICPNLDFRSVYCGSNQRSSVVTTTTLQIVYLTVSIAADETLRNVDFRIRIKIQLSTQFILNINRKVLKLSNPTSTTSAPILKTFSLCSKRKWFWHRESLSLRRW